MNGLNIVSKTGQLDTKDLIHLQIKGKNQLYKEIDEIHKKQYKVFDEMALHRNEETGEVEGPDPDEKKEKEIKMLSLNR